MRETDWRLRFDSASLRVRSVVIETRILAGGCDGDRSVYEGAILPGLAAPIPPRLGEGRHGFVARARDASCRFFAEGCAEVTLPTSEPIEVLLRAREGEARCDDVACVDGLCAGVDFGEGLPPPTPRPIAPPAGAIVAEPPRLRWLGVPGALRYEWALVACVGPLAACPLEGAESWEATLADARPEALAEGRYAWRVRACDAERCSAWSPPRLFALRARGDLDGDGRAELAVGAPERGDREGAVYQHAGASPLPGVAPAERGAPVAEPGARFGLAIEAADLDGDGAPERYVGAPFEDGATIDEGAVWLFGPGEARRLESGAPAAAATFGAALARCDVDGDGLDDLIVGASQRDEGRGEVEVLYGDPDLAFERRRVLQASERRPDARFGATLACVDLDADGASEVVVGAPGDAGPGALSAGAVYVFGPGAVPLVWTSPDREADGRFGAALARAGDVDGDGGQEIFVGAPGERAGDGRGYLFTGRPGELPDTPRAVPSPGAGEAFGAAVAVGDVNGDGAPDLVIGAPAGADGRAYVFLGSEDPAAFELRPGRILDGEGGGFGTALGLLDFDGDGRADLAAGTPDTGGVRLYRGAATGLAPLPDAVWGAPELSDPGRYGAAIAPRQ